MERLTIPDVPIEGGLRRAIIDAREVRKYAMTIYWQLKKYEDVGLTPDQIRELDRLYLDKCEEVNRLKAELAAERQKHRWIPAEERLPDKYMEVLVAFEDGFGGVVAWYSEMDKIWWNANTERPIDAKIIAWQPLPEPYQPEKGGAIHET